MTISNKNFIENEAQKAAVRDFPRISRFWIFAIFFILSKRVKLKAKILSSIIE